MTLDPADDGVGATQRPAPENEALWLLTKRGRFEIRTAPYTPPRDHEIVVKTRALAINPFDWLIQSLGDFIYPWLRYPAILGTDVAGEVFAVGAEVTRFKVGDRVLGYAVGAEKKRNTHAEGVFQRYCVLLDHMASPIPESLRYESAAVLPLALSTAAVAMFETECLAMQPPSADAPPTGKTLLVWGGSTSVGSNAIQLAVAAGYQVITTASPKNFDYVKSLGASAVFDYASATVVADIIKAMKGQTTAGALAIGTGSAKPCLDILAACDGRKFVALASPPVSFVDAPAGGYRRLLWLAPTLSRLIAANVALTITARRRRIGMKFVIAGSLADSALSGVIFGDFLPSALADGRYQAAPEPRVVGQGLASIEGAMAIQKRGVSAQKIVVTL